VIDAIRGLAIALMILDHSIAALEESGYVSSFLEYSRLTITRFSMPLFMLASGLIWATHGLKIYRWAQVLAWAVFLNVATRILWPDFNYPEILLVWAALAVAWKLIVRFPITIMIIGYTQITFWSVPWSGYQPGELAIFLSAGVLAARAPWEKIWNPRKTQRAIKALALLGRYPLSIYGIHLIVLALIVAALNGQLPNF
jgi:uncharacterized membrane protein